MQRKAAVHNRKADRGADAPRKRQSPARAGKARAPSPDMASGPDTEDHRDAGMAVIKPQARTRPAQDRPEPARAGRRFIKTERVPGQGNGQENGRRGKPHGPGNRWAV